MLPQLFKSIAVLLLIGLFSQSWAFAGTHIYIVSSRSGSQFSETIEAFKGAVKQTQGDITFKELNLSTDSSLIDKTILESNNTQLIFALGSKATRQVLSRSGEVPVISTLILSEDLIRQSNHAAGIVLRYPMSVQMGWLAKVLPNVKRVGILYSPGKNAHLIIEAKKQAKFLGLSIVAIAVENPRNLPAALDDMYRRSDVLLAIPDTGIYSGKTLKQIMLSSFRNRVPLIGLSRNWVKSGAIYALESNYQSIGKQGGQLAEFIFRNRKMPSEKIYFPLDINIVINEKTVRHMRQKIDSKIMESAAHVYR